MNPRRFPGAAVAVVTNDKDPEQTGRVKVRFPWMHDDEESHWCRIAATQGGKSRGNFIRPEVGDEVLCMFERGDPNQPWILGSLWNGNDAPPGPGNPDGKNDHKFFQSREGHQLIFNDGDDGGYIEVHDGKQRLHTKIDVPGEHIHWLADSGTITIIAPEGLVRMECVDFLLHSTKTTTINVTKDHSIDVKGTRSYTAKSLTQVGGQSKKITTPNLALSCVVYSASSGGTSVNIGSVDATVEPKLEMELKGPVTRTITGKSSVKAKSFRTESGGPSGPLTMTGGKLDIQADNTLIVKSGGPISLQAATMNATGTLITFGKDAEQGKGLGQSSLVQWMAGSILLNPGMFTFGCAKQLDMMIGADFHHAAPIPPPIPAPFPYMPHGFVNPIVIDTKATVLVNNTPAACVGACAIGMHVPPSLPAPWAPIPMTHRGLITMAIVAGFLPAVIAASQATMSATSALMSGANPMGVLTAGADSPGEAAEQWLMRAFPQFSSPGAFLGLLCMLMPYPIANGNISIGSPNVLAEDAPMAMVVMPFSNSCSDVPIVPNSILAGWSTVQVGVDLASVLKQLAYNAAFSLMAMGAAKGLNRKPNNSANRVDPGEPANLNNSRFKPTADAPRSAAADGPAGPQRNCHTEGHPVDVVSGCLFDKQEDLRIGGVLPLVLERNYNSRVTEAGRGGVLGVGWRLNIEAHLTLHVRASKAGESFWALHDGEMRVIRLPFLEALGEWVSLPGEELEWCRADEDAWDVLDHAGLTWRYHMWREGECRLVAIMDRVGNTIELRYHTDEARPSGLVDASGRHLRLEYDEQAGEGGRLSGIWLEGRKDRWAPQRLVGYAYDSSGRLASVTRPDGLQRRFEYDRLGRMTREHEVGGYAWYFHYDDQDRCTCTYGEDLHEYAAFEYHSELTVAKDHSGRQAFYHYDEEGRVTRVIDRSGGVTEFEFDAEGRKVKETDPEGNAAEWTYEAGRLVEHRQSDGGARTYAYDRRGWLIEEQDAFGGVTRYRHDQAGNVQRLKAPDGAETLRRHDSAGRVVAEVRPDGSERSYDYDEEGNLVAETLDGITTSHRHDLLGRVVETVDPAGRSTRFDYDAQGRRTGRTAPDGSTERWTWCPDGGLESHDDGEGGEWRFARDSMGRLTERRTPEGRLLSTRRGEHARYSSHTDAEGCGWRYTYDGCHRLLRHEEDEVVERYTLDRAGHIARVDLADGGHRRYEVDAAGRPLEVRASDGTRQTLTRGPGGALLEAVEGEARVGFRRDQLGRALDEVGPLGRTRAAWLPGGALRRMEVEGVALTMTRARSGALRSIEAPDGHWSAAGGRLTSPGGARAAQGPSWNLTDARKRRLASYQADFDGDRCVSERLELGGKVVWSHAHRFDRDGRVAERFDGSGNRLEAGRHAGRRLVEDTHGAIDYDARGRVTARWTPEGPQRLWWDDLDRLREVELADGTVLRYAYDALHRLVERLRDPVDGPATRWRFQWWEDRLVGEERPDGTRLRYLWTEADAATPTMIWEESPWHERSHRVLCDQRGAPVLTCDVEGRATWWAEYDAWGVCHAHDRGLDQRLGLVGMWSDPETGIAYNRFRWYVAQWGRYLSPDPMGVSGGDHPYVYADNDPVNLSDPLGLMAHRRGGGGGRRSEAPTTKGTEPRGARNRSRQGTDAGNTPASEMPVTRRGTPEWRAAVKDNQAPGKSKNYRVDSEGDARAMMEESRPGMQQKGDDFTHWNGDKYKTGYEVHPNESHTANAPHNDMPHIKWKDWSGGKSEGGNGHIFFPEAGS